MPTNKNAQLRYQVLDRCFSDFNRRYEMTIFYMRSTKNFMTFMVMILQ